MTKNFPFVILLTLLVGCANLTVEGAKVRVISAQEKVGCKFLKLVTVRASLGPDKTGQALKLALNETAAAGGDSFLPVNINQDWFDGASAAGEALKCGR
jgi:hypothetical protein